MYTAEMNRPCLIWGIQQEQARAQTFWEAGAQTKKKGTHHQKCLVTELKHKQQYTSEAVLDLRFLWAGLDS